MEKTQTLAILAVVLLGITAVCSAYSAFTDAADDSDETEYLDLKDRIREMDQYGGRIYFCDRHVEKTAGSGMSVIPEENYVRVSGSGSSIFYIPYESIGAVTVANH